MEELAPWALAMNAVMLVVIIFLVRHLDSANSEARYWRAKSAPTDQEWKAHAKNRKI